MNLAGKNIWITGASRGIGFSIASELGGSGANLILSSRRANAINESYKTLGANKLVHIYPCDVSSSEEVAATYNKVAAKLGTIDILINNAGLGIFKSFENTSLEDFEKLTNLNFKGVFLCTKSALPAMLASENGLIINILSVVVQKTFLNCSVYSATKSAAFAMCKSLREEVRSKGIKIVNIIPGAVETDIWEDYIREEYGDKMMQPEDIAGTVSRVIEMSQNDRMMIEDITLRPQSGDL